ncbi:MAG: NEAT domain-containing protein [Clostridia bacterium]|nr:NEAT domain-containing protein [Clostridia bacterium]
MKRCILTFLSLVLVVLSLTVWSSAANLSDGVYEVPVTLMHKEDEKESFGNKYIAQTALLKSEGNKKTVTILLTTDMQGIEFFYYTNGSLQGDVAKSKAVSNITVAGKTYEQGFEIPVMAEGDIGLQFSVPVMPMSPSARLRIDYKNAFLISANETTDVPETEQTTQVTTIEHTTEHTTLTSETNETTTEVSTTVTDSVKDYEETAAQITETVDEENETISPSSNTLFSSKVMKYGVPALIVIILIIFGFVIIKRFLNLKK